MKARAFLGIIILSRRNFFLITIFWNISIASAWTTASSVPRSSFSQIIQRSRNLHRRPGSKCRSCCLLWNSNKPEWFDPLLEFGLEEESTSPSSQQRLLPLLLVLPGIDGSGITAWMQYPELGCDYEIRALRIPDSDRSSLGELVETVALAIESAKTDAREVFLLGESLGAGIALGVAVLTGRRPAAAKLSASSSLSFSQQRHYYYRPDGLVLVSPATGWNRTWLGKILMQRRFCVPDPLLSFLLSATLYQLFDWHQPVSAARRIVLSPLSLLFGIYRSPLLQTDARTEYAWNVVRALPVALGSTSAATMRHRIDSWARPCCGMDVDASNLSLLDPDMPMLLVAGTADARVPALEEARRIQSLVPCPCKVHAVGGAGHSGATDDRIDLRKTMEEWRGGVS